MILLAAVLVVLVILVACVYYGQQPVASQTQHLTVDNHTTITVVNNVPPDYTSIALIILALALLLYVVFVYVVPVIRDWRNRG